MPVDYGVYHCISARLLLLSQPLRCASPQGVTSESRALQVQTSIVTERFRRYSGTDSKRGVDGYNETTRRHLNRATHIVQRQVARKG